MCNETLTFISKLFQKNFISHVGLTTVLWTHDSIAFTRWRPVYTTPTVRSVTAGMPDFDFRNTER